MFCQTQFLCSRERPSEVLEDRKGHLEVFLAYTSTESIKYISSISWEPNLPMSPTDEERGSALSLPSGKVGQLASP